MLHVTTQFLLNIWNKPQVTKINTLFYLQVSVPVLDLYLIGHTNVPVPWESIKCHPPLTDHRHFMITLYNGMYTDEEFRVSLISHSVILFSLQ